MPSSNRYTGQKEIRSSTVARVQLPKMIPCLVCKKNKAQEHYSNKQLNDLKSKVSRFGRATITSENSIRCFQCTGTQNVEMKCILCEEFKVLKEFALAQRRNPDKAKCKQCMTAQDLVLPWIPNDYKVQQDEEDSQSDVRRRDPWERDAYTGQFLVNKEDQVKGPRSYVTGSSQNLSGYDTSNNSISGYSEVQWKGASRNHTRTNSAVSGATSMIGGVEVNIPRVKSGNVATELTPGNLASMGPATGMFDKLSLHDPHGGSSDEGSDDDENDYQSMSTATAGPSRATASVVSRKPNQRAYDSDEDDSEGDSRPQRLPPNRVTNKYTAWDQHGNPHDIADTASTVSSSYAPSTNADAVSSLSTVGWNKRISHSGFDYKKDYTVSNNPRKFARVRPQNLDTERLTQGLLYREKDEKKPKARPARTRQAHSDDDEEY